MARPKKSFDFTICERVKESREKAGLTQRDVANALNIPLQTYKNWEQKRNIPDDERLVELAGIFGVNIRWLMNIEDAEIGKHIQEKITADGKIEIKKLSDYTIDELLAEIKRRFEAS